MPELAEVAYFCRRWNPGIGQRVQAVYLNPKARVGRGLNAQRLIKGLVGKTLESSEAAGKQMAFKFSGGLWLGIHLGMTGRLEAGDAEREPTPYDHFKLTMKNGRELVFVDPRQFGRVQFWDEPGVPAWWAKIPSPILSQEFTVKKLTNYLKRRQRAPIKAVLLQQEAFPGIGNWMADEVLWRAGFHPAALAGKFGPLAMKKLHRTLKEVCRDAMRVIGKDWSDPPDTWLFNHRWKDGGICPRSRQPLHREDLRGRTTCWSPRLQKLGAERR
jgi:formamidopyrimidine-DNA glycosylase